MPLLGSVWGNIVLDDLLRMAYFGNVAALFYIALNGEQAVLTVAVS